MHLFYEPLAAEQLFLNEDESRHCAKTLRLGRGDRIFITDGKGNRFSAVIDKADPRRCTFRITEVVQEPVRSFQVDLAVAPTKNLDRIEWFTEKAVELGVDRLLFFVGQHSERKVIRLERLEKIAVSAMKQSLRSILPELKAFDSLQGVLEQPADQRFIAHLPESGPPVHLMQAAQPGGRALVLIGPEGDFSGEELQEAISAGFSMVSLGEARLRTETAALAACHTLNLVNLKQVT